jgi:multidrug efflux pump subunit AcrB
VIITTILPGASPEDVEQSVTDPIEAAVNTVGRSQAAKRSFSITRAVLRLGR